MGQPEASEQSNARVRARFSVHARMAILSRSVRMPIGFSICLLGRCLRLIGFDDGSARLRESDHQEDRLNAQEHERNECWYGIDVEFEAACGPRRRDGFRREVCSDRRTDDEADSERDANVCKGFATVSRSCNVRENGTE